MIINCIIASFSNKSREYVTVPRPDDLFECCYDSSYVVGARWLVGELLLLDTDEGTVDGVVDVGQVVQGWSLSHSAELVVDGSVAQAHPPLVGTEVGHGDATQVSANGRADEHAGVACIGKRSGRALIQLGGGWQGPGLLGLGHCETSDEDHLAVPGGLQDLTWWQLGDVELLVGISDVSGSGDHLVVDDGEDGLDAEAVEGEDEALEHVDLGSLDLVVFVLFIPKPVLIEPVVGLGLGIQGVPEV